MHIDPLMAELWIVALCAVVNNCPPRIHTDVELTVARRGLTLFLRGDRSSLIDSRRAQTWIS